MTSSSTIFKTTEHEHILRKANENLTPHIICKALLGFDALRECDPECNSSWNVFVTVPNEVLQELTILGLSDTLSAADINSLELFVMQLYCRHQILPNIYILDIYVCKMEKDIIILANPIFYKRYVDDTYVRRKKHETDKLFIDLNSYHENIKLTLEINPNKFLDTEIIRTNQGIKTQVYNKAKKLPVHWSSKVPYKYKRNAITGELHRAKRIASNFDDETKRIRSKYKDAGYPKHVIENTIKNFNRKKDELLIPPWLFDERKHVTIRLSFSSKNEKY